MRRLRIVLFLSLAVNLLLAGLVVGWLVSGGAAPRGAGPSGFGLLGEALGPSERRSVARAVVRERSELVRGRRADRQTFARLADALEAEPFEPEAVRAILREFGERLTDRVARGTRIVGEVLIEASPERRAAYAARLREALAEGRGRR